MKVARLRGENNIAKPIMMLTILTLIGKGKIIGNKISYNDELVMTYNNIFKSFRTSILHLLFILSIILIVKNSII